MSKQQVRGLRGGKEARELQKEFIKDVSSWLKDAREESEVWEGMCDVLANRLRESNVILRYVEEHGKLPMGGENFPNSACVYECINDNEKVLVLLEDAK